MKSKSLLAEKKPYRNSRLSIEGTHQVIAKHLVQERPDGLIREFLQLKVWTKESGWTIIVLDNEHAITATGSGRTEAKAFEQTRKAMAARGLWSDN